MRRELPFVLMLACLSSQADAGARPKVDQIRTLLGTSHGESFMFRRAADLEPFPGAQLVGVEYEFAFTVSGGGVVVDNDGPTGGEVDIDVVISGRTTSEGIALGSLMANTDNSALLWLAPDDEHPGGVPVLDLDGGDDVAHLAPLDRVPVSDMALFNQPGLVDMFTGSGEFTLGAEISTSFSLSQMPALAGSFSTVLIEDALLRLSYIYAPSPGALSLFGVCALGRRRRR